MLSDDPERGLCIPLSIEGMFCVYSMITKKRPCFLRKKRLYKSRKYIILIINDKRRKQGDYEK